MTEQINTPVIGILESTINGLQVELMIEAKGLLYVNGNYDGIC